MFVGMKERIEAMAESLFAKSGDYRAEARHGDVEDMAENYRIADAYGTAYNGLIDLLELIEAIEGKK